jgi:hypothetical protein
VSKHPISEAIKTRHREADELAAHKEKMPIHGSPHPEAHSDPMVGESLDHLLNLHPRIEGDRSIIKNIKRGYTKDPLCTKVFANIEHHATFEISDDLLYTRNCLGKSVLCIPLTIQGKRRLTEVVITQAHKVLGHLGPQKTADYRLFVAIIGGRKLARTLNNSVKRALSAKQQNIACKG